MHFEWTGNVVSPHADDIPGGWRGPRGCESDVSSIAMIVRLSWQPEEPPDETMRSQLDGRLTFAHVFQKDLTKNVASRGGGGPQVRRSNCRRS